MNTTGKNVLLALGLLALSAFPAAGQSHPNRTKGFDPRGTYAIGDVDSINLFNGALTVTIPLGPRYPVGSSDYGFALVYNSNAWTVREICPDFIATGAVTFNSSLRTQCYEYDDNGDGQTDRVECNNPGHPGWTSPGDDFDPHPATGCYNLARPNPSTNAGLGWQLNLGKLFGAETDVADRARFVVEGARWNYVGGDGAQHGFSGVSGNAFFTRDGSYLRMKACTEASTTCKLVEFPDGSMEKHELHSSGQEADWRLVRRADAFGRGFTVTYFSGLSWRIEDDDNRVHLVTLEQPDTEFPAHISLIQLDTTGTRPLTVDLVHDPEELNRAAPHNDTGVGGPPIAPRITAQLLTRIDLKAGSTLLSQWSFGEAGVGYEVDQPLTARINGVLKRLKMPTGATVAWSFGGGYKYPSGASGRGHLRSAVGVLSRTVTDVTGAAIGTWTYEPVLEERPPDDDCQYGNNIPWLPKCHEKEFTNTVKTPGGYRTKHYFSVFPLPPFFDDEETDDTEHWDGEDYGLPFTRKATLRVLLAGTELYLSTESFAPNAPDSAPIRRGYVRYERDAELDRLAWDGYHSQLQNNERVAAQAEVFEDDLAPNGSKRWRLTRYDRWDGKGHYRDLRVSSNFPGEADRSRKVTTEFTSGQPANHQPWFLGKFTEVVTEDFGSSALLSKQVRQVCFDGSTPFISRTRTLAESSAGPTDVLAVFTRNPLGQVTEERLYGGDGANLGTGDLCGVLLPATPTSLVVHSYSHGVRSQSVVKEPCSGTNVVTLLDQDIDASGVPTVVKDAAGVAVTLSYDALGRRTAEQPEAGAGARTEYSYLVPGIGGHGAMANAQVNAERKPNAGGAMLSYSQVHFDGLGRTVADATWMPAVGGNGVGQAVSRSLLSAEGWPLQISTPRCSSADLGAACVPGVTPADISAELAAAFPTNGVTKYEEYDPFGRPARVVAPDGFVSTATYTGVRVVERTVKVGTGVGVLSNATRTEEYDFLGRLAAVTEPSGVNGAAVKTTYTYDVGDRLVSVETDAGSVTQSRSFEYDGRGFLRRETHPELGVSGHGTKVYEDHDARGLAGHSAVLTTSAEEAAGTGLNYQYDAAGRLIEVREGTLPLEQYFYDWANGTAGRSAGKIVQARRYNPSSQVTVSEQYEYNGVAGRVSKRTTRTSLGHRFEIAATYNQLGDVETVTYPTCAGLVGCLAETVSPPRTVTYGYQLGFLTKVGEGTNPTTWLTTTEYAPSGRWRKLTRPNGTTDEQVGDAKGLGRPREFKLYKGPTLLWETGLGGYTYDGAGNITAMGPEKFTHDKVSRLKSGTVKTLPLDPGTSASETLSYDAFGNQLTRVVTGTLSTPAPAVSSSTNRLTAVGTTYDANGNMIADGTFVHGFDALSALSFTTQGSQTTHYLYAPGGERLATLRQGGITTWTLRGFGNEVLRVFEQDAADTWRRQRDYIYRGGQLLASDAPAPEGVNHYHLDHLGSTRVVTDSAGQRTAFHAYLPFGQEVTAPAASATKVKYTGHEREEGLDSVSRADDLDYMHARWCSPTAGRFLSVDPVLGRVGAPQSWNRYAYVRGNPVVSIDPDGKDQWVLIWGPSHDGIGHAAIGVQDRGPDGKPTGTVTFRHLWPAEPVGKSQEAPADYRIETVPESRVMAFHGGEGRVADGIIKIAGDVQRDKNVVAALIDGQKNPKYLAPSNTCSTYCARGVAAAGIPVNQTGRVVVTLGGIAIKSQDGITTPVAVYNSIAASKDSRLQILKPLYYTDPNLKLEY